MNPDTASTTASGAHRGLDGATVVLSILALFLTGGVFLADVLSNPRVGAAALYSLVLFYCWLFRGERTVLVMAVVCTVLSLVDIALARGELDDVAGINKIISIGVIWVSAALVLLVKSSTRSVEEAGRRLEAEAAKFETALEHAPNAVLMLDASGAILLVNRQAEALFGRTRRALLSSAIDTLLPEIGAVHGERAARELVAKRRNGTEVPVEVGLNPIATPGGTVVIASIVDVTARKLAAELLVEQHRLVAERLTREMKLAERIQTSILPRAPFVPGLEIGGRMVPATEVGGDYYDVFAAKDGCWLAIGDVSGHGLDAGLVSLMLQSVTSAVLHSAPDVEPSRALVGINATLHQNVAERLGRPEYATFTLLRYQTDGTVLHCGAHQDILVWRAATRTVERHPTTGAWLAVRAEVDAPTNRIHLADGDVLVLFTDGLLESRDADGEMLGMNVAMELVGTLAEGTVDGLVDGVVNGVLERVGTREDDITVVALRHRARARPSPPMGR